MFGNFWKVSCLIEIAFTAGNVVSTQETVWLTVWKNDEELEEIWQRENSFDSLIVINDHQPMSLTHTHTHTHTNTIHVPVSSLSHASNKCLALPIPKIYSGFHNFKIGYVSQTSRDKFLIHIQVQYSFCVDKMEVYNSSSSQKIHRGSEFHNISHMTLTTPT